MLAAGSITDILNNIDFWRGVGRFLIDLFLVFALLTTVLAVSGHPPRTWPFSRSRSEGGSAGEQNPPKAPTPAIGGTDQTHSRPASSERHREYLDQLGTALKYQGSTVVLIVFAVILLGFQRVLAGPEVATILSGIAGFVLGQTKSSTPEVQAGATLTGGGGSGNATTGSAKGTSDGGGDTTGGG